MRRCKYLRYIPVQKDPQASYRNMPGTGVYEDEMREGWFLQWGLMAVDGLAVTCAIIESQEGLVELVEPNKMQFVDLGASLLAQSLTSFCETKIVENEKD